jgi:hypothetical protein
MSCSTYQKINYIMIYLPQLIIEQSSQFIETIISFTIGRYNLKFSGPEK